MKRILEENETMRDLTERLEEAFALVHDIAPVAFWYENLYGDGRIKDIHFSARMREMLGYKSDAEFPDELNTLTRLIHPDDVNIMLENAIAAGTGKTDKYDVKYRIRTAAGEYMWCNATGCVVKDRAGKTVGMYGAFIDISSEVKRELEAAAQNAEAELHREAEIQLKHEQLRSEVLNYMIDHGDDDPIELLKNFAERIRTLIDCD